MDFLFSSLVIIVTLTGFIGLCGILLNYPHVHFRRRRQLNFYCILYFLTSFFNWLNLLFDYYFPDFIIITNTIWCFAVMLNPVFLFMIVESSTYTPGKNVHRIFSYIFPTAGIATILLIFLIRVAHYPERGIATLVESGPVIVLISVFGSCYMLMNLYLIRQYRRHIGKNDDGWVSNQELYPVFAGISIILLVMSPVWFTFFSSNWLIYTATVFLMLLFAYLHILLATRVILTGKEFKKVPAVHIQATTSTNMPIIKITGSNTYIAEPSTVALPLNKRYFNHWMKKSKPYLNPVFRIEELALLYGVSVKEMSSFLNREYRMNFNQYINRCRLAELRQLRIKHKHTRLSELVPKAGFGSMISYSRAKAIFEKKKEKL